MSATGTLGVRALLDDETTPILGVRYTYRLTQADGPGLLFAWAQLGPPEDGHRALEHILHPYTFRVRDGESSGWPPPHDRQVMQPGSPWLGVSNFASEPVSLTHTSRPRLYPRSNWGVDGDPACVKPTAVGQRSVLGREIAVEFGVPIRRELHRWWLTLNEVRRRSALDVDVVADVRGDYSIRPTEALAFVTEFFDGPGHYDWQSWDHAVLQGGKWNPVRAFLAHHVPDCEPPTIPRGYGFAAEQGRLVLRTGLRGNPAGERIAVGGRA